MNHFPLLKDLVGGGNILGTCNSVYHIIYANGKKRTRRIKFNPFTNKELNTSVLNVFAIQYNEFQLHLARLGVNHDNSISREMSY